MNILLVDDEPDIVNNLGMLLQRLGHRCSIFYGTEGALMAAERSLFDVVITDLNMPGRNGLCFVKALRNLYDGLRAIIITGELNWAASHPDLAAQVQHVLYKPLDLFELVSILNEMNAETRMGGALSIVPVQHCTSMEGYPTALRAKQ